MQISLVACGLGPDTLTAEAQSSIAEADILFGSARLLQSYAGQKPAYPLYQASEIKAKIAELKLGPEAQVAVLVSGDSGFFSASAKFTEYFPASELRILPGISSLAGLAARLKRPWQEVAIQSLHGREASPIASIRRNRDSFFLLGQHKKDLQDLLCHYGYGDLQAHLGENLGQAGERISSQRLAELDLVNSAPLSVLWVENPQADARIPAGLPDESFVRGKVPMSKAEVRAVILSKLALRPRDICYDIGAGTGSVSVEMALAAYAGRVYALEYKAEALELIAQNKLKFKLDNLEIIASKAPAGLAELPCPDAVFIGGSEGQMGPIVESLFARNPQLRLVLTAVTWESLVQVKAVAAAQNLEAEAICLQISRAEPLGAYHLFRAQNPIYIFTLSKKVS